MRWLKHLTNTWNDERIAQLVGTGGKDGLAAYGAYWRVQEILASQMEGQDPSCSVQYSVTRWSVLLSVRGSHVGHYLGQLAKNDLVTVEWIGSDIKVTNRKLLKYRDEYSRKSGHGQESVRPRTDTDTDTEQKKRKTTAPTELEGALLSDSQPPIPGSPSKAQVVVDAWNAITAGKLSKARLTPPRQRVILTRLKEPGWFADFEAGCRYIITQPWCLGQNERNWKATIDYLLQSGKATELAEKAAPAAPGPVLIRPQTQYEIDRERQLEARRLAIREAGKA